MRFFVSRWNVPKWSTQASTVYSHSPIEVGAKMA
jgi:hypothetical protein